jgi:hypothetical protein
MTILNINVRADRVLLGMDTLVLNTTDGSQVEMSKFGVLPEANAVVAWRGDRVLHSNIFLECFAANIYADLDVLEPLFPQLIMDRASLLRDHYAKLGAPQEFLDNPHLATVEMMMAGWSKAANRMRCARFTLRPGDSAVGVEAIDGSRIAPGDILEPAEAIDPTSIGAMERLAKFQLAAAHRRGIANQGFGGSFLIVEITRDELRIRRRAIFPKG